VQIIRNIVQDWIARSAEITDVVTRAISVGRNPNFPLQISNYK
jgi:hypothetical protein